MERSVTPWPMSLLPMVYEGIRSLLYIPISWLKSTNMRLSFNATIGCLVLLHLSYGAHSFPEETPPPPPSQTVKPILVSTANLPDKITPASTISLVTSNGPPAAVLTNGSSARNLINATQQPGVRNVYGIDWQKALLMEPLALPIFDNTCGFGDESDVKVGELEMG